MCCFVAMLSTCAILKIKEQGKSQDTRNHIAIDPSMVCDHFARDFTGCLFSFGPSPSENSINSICGVCVRERPVGRCNITNPRREGGSFAVTKGE